MDLNLPNQQDSDQSPNVGNYYTPYNVDIGRMSDRTRLDQFISRVLDLDKKLRFLLTDFGTAEFIEDKLGVQFKLSDNQKSEITRIIRDVILTDVYIGDMPGQISSKLGVDQNTALEIARVIVSQLFAPVIEEIKKLQLQKFGKLPGSSAFQQTRQNFAPQNLGGQVRPLQHIIGEELPETGGNIIDLRKANH